MPGPTLVNNGIYWPVNGGLGNSVGRFLLQSFLKNIIAAHAFMLRNWWDMFMQCVMGLGWG